MRSLATFNKLCACVLLDITSSNLGRRGKSSVMALMGQVIGYTGIPILDGSYSPGWWYTYTY
jgi:hypothetical protein